MAQTKSRRRRKHRGTPAGTIERAGRTGRPRTREEARQITRRRRAERLDKPPSWRSSIQRAAIAAAIVAGFMVIVAGRPVTGGIALGLIMLAIYAPLGYATDSAIHRFRQRRRQAAADRGDARK
jgi:hypothetical protein